MSEPKYYSIINRVVFTLCLLLVVIISFQLGIVSYQKAIEAGRVKNQEAEALRTELGQLQRQIALKEEELAALQGENDGYLVKQKNLLADINKLRARVAGISTQTNGDRQEQRTQYPFAVPTTGVLGSIHGSFNGQLYGDKHLGVDIWTSQANGGRLASHRGNPVYSACSGKVVSLTPENGGVTVKCDPIVGSYNVPARSVYTHYAHMGHAETRALYYSVKVGQRVEKREFIGYQGDISSYFPEMRNVHLHFSVFTGQSESDPNGGAIDPCLYIGGNCAREGEVFSVD